MRGRRTNNQQWRDPRYYEGLCGVCRKRAREFNHEDYPSMCAKCRGTRTRPITGNREVDRTNDIERQIYSLDMPIEEIRRRAREIQATKTGIRPAVQSGYVYKKDIERAQQKCVHGFHLDHCGKAGIQNLNGKLDPRIQALFNKQETGK